MESSDPKIPETSEMQITTIIRKRCDKRLTDVVKDIRKRYEEEESSSARNKDTEIQSLKKQLSQLEKNKNIEISELKKKLTETEAKKEYYKRGWQDTQSNLDAAKVAQNAAQVAQNAVQVAQNAAQVAQRTAERTWAKVVCPEISPPIQVQDPEEENRRH